MSTVLAAIHILAACVWVGGTVALVFIAVPAARQLDGPERAAALRFLGRRWRPIGWSALGVLVVTGLAQAAHEGLFRGDTSTRFDVILGIKAGLVILLAGGAYVHDYVLGPGLARQIREGREQTLRPILVRVGWANFTLTIVVPILGAVLSHLDS